jgi:hypothetical protein
MLVVITEKCEWDDSMGRAGTKDVGDDDDDGY